MSKKSHAKHEQKQKHKSQIASYEKPHEDYQAGAFGDTIIILLIIGLGLFFVVPFFPYMSDNTLLIVLAVFILIIVVFAYLLRKKRRK
jgi:LPXTG-motif cell wall-anchored protein